MPFYNFECPPYKATQFIALFLFQQNTFLHVPLNDTFGNLLVVSDCSHHLPLAPIIVLEICVSNV